MAQHRDVVGRRVRSAGTVLNGPVELVTVRKFRPSAQPSQQASCGQFLQPIEHVEKTLLPRNGCQPGSG